MATNLYVSTLMILMAVAVSAPTDATALDSVPG